jgi:hypothetical protein
MVGLVLGVAMAVAAAMREGVVGVPPVIVVEHQF